MSRATRLAKLEAGPAGAQSLQSWAARYGWPAVWNWLELESRRVRAKLMEAIGQEPEPIPAETELERTFHESMAHTYPPEGDDRQTVLEKLKVQR
jgi:hypothetical protein